MKHKIILALCLLCMGVMGATAKTFEVTVKKPGTLENYWNQLSHEDRKSIDKVVLRGELNDDDCHILRQMCGNGREQQRTRFSVKIVDLADVTFVAGGSKGYIDHFSMRRILPGQQEMLPIFLFRNTTVQEVTLPKNLQIIGAGAFEFSDLKRIVIPKSVKLIDTWAFKDCWSLTEVVVEGDLVQIGCQAFYGLDSIEKFVFNSVDNITSDSFGYCEKLKEITFKGYVKEVGLRTIVNCPSLKAINFNGGVEKKEDPIHVNCPLVKGLNIVNKQKSEEEKYEYKIY